MDNKLVYIVKDNRENDILAVFLNKDKAEKYRDKQGIYGIEHIYIEAWDIE